MTMPNVGDKAPDFSMPASNGKTVKLSDYKGKMLVLYFYPKDDTPGCTKEACAFRDNLPAFNKLGVDVIGVSKDPLDKHDKFINKYDLNFILASDADSDTCEKYGTWVEKNMYGKKYMGIQRATFLINGQGKIERVWPKVKVPGHVEDILQSLKNVKAEAA